MAGRGRERPCTQGMLLQPLKCSSASPSLPECSRGGRRRRGGVGGGGKRTDEGGQRQEGGGGKPAARELGLFSVDALQSPALVSRLL